MTEEQVRLMHTRMRAMLKEVFGGVRAFALIVVHEDNTVDIASNAKPRERVPGLLRDAAELAEATPTTLDDIETRHDH